MLSPVRNRPRLTLEHLARTNPFLSGPEDPDVFQRQGGEKILPMTQAKAKWTRHGRRVPVLRFSGDKNS